MCNEKDDTSLLLDFGADQDMIIVKCTNMFSRDLIQWLITSCQKHYHRYKREHNGMFDQVRFLSRFSL